MFLGSAILLATILFLVDRNKVWKQFFWASGSLCVAAVLLGGGFFGWEKWQERRREKPQAATIESSKYEGQSTPTAAGTPIAADAAIAGGPVAEKKYRRFGNATVEADTAVVMSRGTFITTLSRPARVMVLGTKDSKYQIRLADGRTGEIDMNEIKIDAFVKLEKASATHRPLTSRK